MVPTHTLIFCTSVRWNLSIVWLLVWQGSHFRLILRLQCLPFALQVDLLLQVGLPIVLQVDSCFRIVSPSLFTYLPSAQILMRTVMNQIARGGYSPTPPEEDAGVPHASRSQGLEGPDPSLQLEP